MFKIEHNKIIVDIYKLAHYVHDDIKLELIKTLALEDVVINDVTDQIISSFTDDGSSGSSITLSNARMRIAVALGSISKNVIQDLQNSLNDANDKLTSIYKERNELRNFHL